MCHRDRSAVPTQCRADPPARVRSVRRGYDPDQVRDYLMQIADQIENLEEELRRSEVAPEARPRRAGAGAARPRVARSPTGFGDLVSAPRTTRRGDRRGGRGVESRTILNESRAEADRIRVDAQSRAEEVRQRGQRALCARVEAERACSGTGGAPRDPVGAVPHMQSGCSASRTSSRSRSRTTARSDGLPDGRRTREPPRRRALPGVTRDRRTETGIGHPTTGASSRDGLDDREGSARRRNDSRPAARARLDDGPDAASRPALRSAVRVRPRPAIIGAWRPLRQRLDEIESRYRGGDAARCPLPRSPTTPTGCERSGSRSPSSARSSSRTASTAPRGRGARRASDGRAESEPEMATYLREEAERGRRARRRAARQARGAPPVPQATRTTTRTSSWRSAPAPAARRPRSGRASFSSCTGASPSATAGRPTSSSTSPSDLGGFKEVVLEVRGKGAYSALKHESGVHRVQRVPVTESSGELHTSDGDRGRAPRGGGRRRAHRSRGHRDAGVPLLRTGRAVGQHLELGGPDHPQADRASSSRPRRSAPSSRTGRRRCAISARDCCRWRRRRRARRRRPSADRRSAAATAPNGSGTYNFPQNRVDGSPGEAGGRPAPAAVRAGGDIDAFVDAPRRTRARATAGDSGNGGSRDDTPGEAPAAEAPMRPAEVLARAARLPRGARRRRAAPDRGDPDGNVLAHRSRRAVLPRRRGSSPARPSVRPSALPAVRRLPLQHVTGEQPFRSLTLACSRGCSSRGRRPRSSSTPRSR